MKVRINNLLASSLNHRRRREISTSPENEHGNLNGRISSLAPSKTMLAMQKKTNVEEIRPFATNKTFALVILLFFVVVGLIFRHFPSIHFAIPFVVDIFRFWFNFRRPRGSNADPPSMTSLTQKKQIHGKMMRKSLPEK